MVRIGFDIGGTHARLSLFDDDWSARHTAKERLREDTSATGVAARMAQMLDAALDATDADADDITCVGVGIAAQLDVDGRTVLNAPNLGWRDLPFADTLEAHLPGAPSVLLVNDLNALLLGEAQAGGVQGCEDVLAVYVGTGVGGAILSGGELIEGRGKAGEIGHVKVAPEGRACGCGEFGCLEAYAGGVHLEARIDEVIARRDDDAFAASLKHEQGHVDLKEADALSYEDEEIHAIWADASAKLALAIANACTLLNPEKLLLGGGVWDHCPTFRERTLAHLPGLILEVARKDLEIASPTLGDTAGMLGAATLAHRRMSAP